MQDEKCRWYNNGFCLKGLAGTKCELKYCVAHLREED